MTSCEEQKQVSKLYIKIDKGACTFVSELEYPTPRMLTTWCREYFEVEYLHQVL